MSNFSVTLEPKNYNVSLKSNPSGLRVNTTKTTPTRVTVHSKKFSVTKGVESQTSAKVQVGTPTVRPAVSYHLDTPASNDGGVIDLVYDTNNTVTDSVVFVGQGIANVTSNGSSIVVDASVGNIYIDGGVF